MFYTADVSDIAAVREADDSRLGMDHPSGYIPDGGLVDAVNVALLLNRPLLVTGEPGTGKTQLAYSVAWQLYARRAANELNVTSTFVNKFETKSTSAARDLFYTFDALGRFHSGRAARNLDFITYGALGRALVDALPAADAAPVLPPGHPHAGPRRSVVLVDEIDKAPRDFPNDLLNEIDQMYFRVPELGSVVIGGADRSAEAYKPIVIITSNSERTLPEPFLRRCIYYDISFPDRDALERIVLTRLRHLEVVKGPLVDDTLAFYFEKLRTQQASHRTISPAELIQWLTVILRRGGQPTQRLAAVRDAALEGIPALAKDRDEQAAIRALVLNYVGAQPAR